PRPSPRHRSTRTAVVCEVRRTVNLELDGDQLRLGIRLVLAGILRLQAAAERGSIGHLHFRTHEIAVHAPARLDFNPLARRDVPRHGAIENDDARHDLSGNVRTEPDRQYVFRQRNLSFDAAFDGQVLGPRQLTLDDERGSLRLGWNGRG